MNEIFHVLHLSAWEQHILYQIPFPKYKQTHIIRKSCEADSIHFKYYIAGLQLSSGPGRLVGE